MNAPQTTDGSNELLHARELLERAGVTPHMTVADFGCGNAGYFTIPASTMVGDKGTVYAVDVVQTVLSSVSGAAKLAGCHNVQTVWSNLEHVGATKIPENTVDVTLLINILFQTQDQASVIKEAARLTKAGGKILIVDWKITATPLGPSQAVRISPESIRIAARDANLDELDSFDAGHFHFGLLFRKL